VVALRQLLGVVLMIAGVSGAVIAFRDGDLDATGMLVVGALDLAVIAGGFRLIRSRPGASASKRA